MNIQGSLNVEGFCSLDVFFYQQTFAETSQVSDGMLGAVGEDWGQAC